MINLQEKILEAYNKLEPHGWKARSRYELELNDFLLRFYVVEGENEEPTDDLEIHFTTHADYDVGLYPLNIGTLLNNRQWTQGRHYKDLEPEEQTMVNEVVSILTVV